MCGLGKGLAETGMLNPEGKARALAALKRFSLLAKGMNIDPAFTVVATAATREAEDGPEFQAAVLQETGLKLHVIDGAEEARLSAQGVLLGWPEAKGVVCDIGGNSMELARISDGSVGKRVSTPLGPFRLQQIPDPKKRRAHIAKVLKDAQSVMKSTGERIYLVGGSWRVIARLDMERRNYPLTVLHEYRMTPKGLTDTLDWLASTDLAALRGRTGTSAERMELVPLACEVLRESSGC